MVLEYTALGSLFEMLHTRKDILPIKRILEYIQDISLGMTYLHHRNIIHGDIKSKNIVVDEGHVAKICDFGLSEKTKKKLNMAGTLNWLAPEVLKEEGYFESSDVYSFGLVIWEMLTNQIPYSELN